MKKVLVFGALCLFAMAGAYLYSVQPVSAQQCPVNDVNYRSGCCSRHGGVCGCDKNSGHYRCCDGTTSPSCGCM